MTLLGLVRQMCYEVGIAAPIQVITSQDPQIQQITALLNRFGRDLARQYVWQELNKEYLISTRTLTTTGNVTQGSAVITGIPDTSTLTTDWGASFDGAAPFSQLTSVGLGTVTLNQPSQSTGVGVSILFGQVNYLLPMDWLRQVENTEWDRSNRWPLNGPVSPQDWQSFKSGIVYAGPRLRFRIAGNTIQLNPPPETAGLLSMEYVSENWIVAQDGFTKAQFTADTDSAVFDESLLVEGLKLRWNKAKGFAFDEKSFKDLLETCLAQNKSTPVLSLAHQCRSVLLGPANVPDGNWPGA